MRLLRGYGPAPDDFSFHLCYLDESGVIERAAGTPPNFVLLGLAIPGDTWKVKDSEISALKVKHRIGTAEIHTGWMARRYTEQERIRGFDAMSETSRRAAVERERRIDLNAAAGRGRKAAKAIGKQHKKTAAYAHLTLGERQALLREVANAIGSWDDCVLFADVQNKSVRDPRTPDSEIFDHAFEQVVARFNTFLTRRGSTSSFGLLVQDKNETASDRLTWLMRRFHERGTAWSDVSQIVETPLFVDSALTSMVQLADVCSYATRRFVENNEVDLFDRIYPRFDRFGSKLVGLRHYTGRAPCSCRICQDHGR